MVKIFEQSAKKNIAQVYQLNVCKIFWISSPGWMLLAPTARQSISRWRLTRWRSFWTPRGFFQGDRKNEPVCKYDVPACIAVSSMFFFRQMLEAARLRALLILLRPLHDELNSALSSYPSKTAIKASTNSSFQATICQHFFVLLILRQKKFFCGLKISVWQLCRRF